MSAKHWIRQLRSSPQLSERLHAVRRLEALIHQPAVHTALCLTAVDTRHASLRAALLAVLKKDPRAETFFLGVARGQGPTYMRKWAIINLNHLGSQRAREVVLTGLRDPSEEVRRAAACHASLYTDEEARQAFIDFFQTQRHVYLKDMVGRLCVDLHHRLEGLRSIRIRPDIALGKAR